MIFQTLHDKLKRDMVADGDGDGVVMTLCLLHELAEAEKHQPDFLAAIRRRAARRRSRARVMTAMPAATVQEARHGA